jgi:hyperosmotically inducible protein
MGKPLLVALLLFGFANTAFAADRTNADLFRDVSTQVNRYVYFTIFDSVHAEVDDGVVTLSGKVTMPYKASEIEKRIARLQGVKSVRNTISVLPVSTFDNGLRRQIARAIYAHPVLFKYGVGANPSIHVIVENGRVTLDGVIDHEMDKVIATSIARSSMAFEVRNELKTPEEVTQALEKL